MIRFYFKLFPSKYIENLSHAQVMARASFSICAQRSFVVDIEQDAYATGCHVVLTFCKSTPPSPYEDASAESFISAAGL